MVAGTRSRARGESGPGAAARGRGRAARGSDSGVVAQPEAVAEPSGYELQREERIRENRAKLEALGIRGLASALRNDEEVEEGARDGDGGSKRVRRRAGGNGKCRDAGGDGDDDYRPEDEGSSSCSSDRESNEEDEEKGRGGSGRGGGLSPGRRTPRKKVEMQRKRSKTSTTASKAATLRKEKLFHAAAVPEPDNNANEEAILQQAIALSLGESNPNYVPVAEDALPVAGSGRGPGQVPGKGKRRKQDAPLAPPRVQVTEDQAVAYFFTLDEAGKGYITVRDLQKMALAHDFCWKDEEMADMIYLFDADGNGKLNISDFHKILCRCNFVQDSKIS